MQEERVAKIFLQLFDALSYAHERRIIHRDVKPSNLILSLDSRGREKVHILDFGIAKFASPAKNLENSITGSGEIIGSPVYMSPEQCRGERVSEASDLYSAGCCLFFCLTGKPPLKGPNALATIAAKLEGKTESLALHQERLGISTSLVELTDQLIQREPSNRIKSAAEAAQRLRRMISPSKPATPASGPDKKAGRGKIVLTVLALAGISLTWLTFGTTYKGQDSKTNNKPSSSKLLKVHLDQNTGSYCLEFSQDLTEKRNLGSIGYFSGNEREMVTHPLRGVFSVPATAALQLALGPGIGENLRIIDDFPANLVTSVTLSGDLKEQRQIIEKLKHFSSLRAISLEGSSVDDNCLEFMESMHELRGLHITNTAIRPEKLGKSLLLKRLNFLRISGKFPVGRIFQASGKCPKLNELALYDTEISRGDLSLLKELPKLRTLGLEFENLEALPLLELQKCKTLRKLNITGAEVSDGKLAELGRLKNLKELVSRGSRMSSAQLKELKRALPETRLEIDIFDLGKATETPALPSELIAP